MFTPIDTVVGSRFNSALSCNFLDAYMDFATKQILQDEVRQPSKTFAPSTIRCKRISWFRLRGVEPEPETNVDLGLNFTAQVGTACHQTIQTNLAQLLGDDWLDVEEYFKSANLPYEYTCTNNGTETLVELTNPPMKFAPDGILRYEGKVRLLEIKTSEYDSFNKLSAPKSHHMDQIKCYCTILNLHDAIVIYQDRLYGDMKCFEVHVSDGEMNAIRNMFSEVQDCVKKNIAPPRLPKGDRWCTKAHCRYYGKCQEW